MSVSTPLIDRFRTWIRFSDDGAEMVDRTLQSTTAATNIAIQVMQHQGKGVALPTRIRDGVSDAGAVVSLSRLTWAIGGFFSGSAFIQTNPDGSLKVDKGHYVWNSFALITLKVALFVGRALNLTNWLNSKNAYQLDTKHTQRIDHATSAAFTLVSACGLYLAAKDAMQVPSSTELTAGRITIGQYNRRAFMDMTRNGFDLLSSVFDIAKSSSYGCGVASAVLSLGSGLSSLAYECAWHQPQ